MNALNNTLFTLLGFIKNKPLIGKVQYQALCFMLYILSILPQLYLDAIQFLVAA